MIQAVIKRRLSGFLATLMVANAILTPVQANEIPALSEPALKWVTDESADREINMRTGMVLEEPLVYQLQVSPEDTDSVELSLELSLPESLEFTGDNIDNLVSLESGDENWEIQQTEEKIGNSNLSLSVTLSREETEEQPASPAKSMRQEPAVPAAPVKQGQTAGELPAVTTAAETEIQESSVPESSVPESTGAESTDLESSTAKEETSESDGTENSSAEDISQESSAGKQEETEETSFQGEWEESVPETSEESTEEENSVPETAEPETSESETAEPEEFGEHTEEGTQKDSAPEISAETAGEEGEKNDSGDSALEPLSETIEEIIEETRSVVEALTRTRKMRRLVFATPGDTVQTATPGQTVPDEKEPDDTETDDTEPDDTEPAEPFILTVTIHGSALKAVAPLADGKIRLEARMKGESVKTETTVKAEPVLFEGLSPTTDPADCEPFTKNIYWIDNKNEAKARKTNEEMAKLIEENIRFTVDGTTYDYTLENVKNILKMELDELPKPNVKAGDQSLTVSYGDTAFPKWLGYKDDKGDFINAYEITWTFTPPAVSQYDPQDVNEDTIKNNYPSLQAQAPGCYGWYYLLVEEQKFNIVLRSGASYNAEGNLNYDEVKKAILENFQVCVDRPGNPTLVKLPLQGMMEGNEILYEVLTELPEGVEDAPDAANKMAVITVTNGWKYNVNGERMKYWIDMIGQTEGEDPQIDAPLMVATGATADAPEGPQDDTTGKYKNHLKVTYDNTGTIYSDQEGGTYPDGKLILTLSSEAYYEATKVWNDQGVQNVERPTATMELWRYRNGEDYTSATPVRNNENKIVTVELGKDTTIIDANTEKVTIAAENRLFLDSMPKYDSEGYRYIYVLKEFMSGTNADKYQQVMGSIKQTGDNTFEITDTLPTWLPKYEEGFTPASDGQRLEGNTFLYNGGTLSNCLDVDTTVSAVKSWKAASFQADFDDVAVELTLQYRPLNPNGTPDGNWAPVIGEDGKEVQQMKYGFTEEELAAWNVSATAPKYGLLGRLLEYRWVESAVYQAPEGADLKGYCASSGAKNLLNTDGSFSLKQNGRTVHYRSTAMVSTPANAETPVTAIVNRMEDTIDYTVEKKWEGGLEPQKVSFAIYRLRSGDSLNNATEKYLSFTLFPDGNVEFNGQVPQEGITIEKVGETSMKAKISGLPEFDEHGAEYQYVLLEDYTGAGWIPGYTTTRDENRDYNTTVVNAPGPGQRIMVRKEWIDDSDVTHREEVTIEVYVKGILKNTVTLSKNNEWSALVSVTDPVDPEKKINLKDIYIIETEAGGNTVEYSKNTDWNNLSSVTGEYESDFHRYEVTYEEPQNILGEDVFTVRNRRVNEVNLTVTKIWKDNNGMLRKALTEAFDKIFTGENRNKKPVLSLKLRFATDEEERGCRIEKDATGTVSLVSIGSPANAQPIQDDQGFQVSHIQPVDYGTEGDAETGKWQDYEDTYYFWNLPKYDATGAVLHYTVDELWLTPDGDPIENLEKYLKDIDENVFETYPDLKELLSEHTISVTEQKYIVGENEEPGNSASLGGEILPYTYQYTRGKAIVPDRQTMTFQNALTGTKSVYWHKLWDDAYAFSRGNRPDIYMDIFQVVQVEDHAGQLKQSIKLFKKDYRWDATTSTDLGAVIDKGNDLNHWHVVLDNLPKYDPVTGREYYYYAVERAMVNIKQFDYNDVAYYFTKTGTKDTGTGEGADKVDGRLTWPDTGTKNLTKVGMARMSKENVPSEYQGSLAFDYNAPAKLILVSEENAGHVPEGKFYDYPHYMLLEGGYFSNTLQEDVIIQGQKLWVGLPDSYPDTSLPAVKFNLYRKVDTTGKGEEETRTDDPGEFVASTTITDWVHINKNGTYKFQMTHYTDEDGKPAKVTVDENGTKILEEVDSVEKATKLPQYNEQGFRYVYTLVEDEIFWDNGGSSTPLRSGDPEKPEDDRAGIFINTTQVGSKDFTSTNSYKGVNGSLSVRKILKLEPSSYQWSGGWVYPNVRFKLTRQYKNEEDSLIEDASFSRTVTWTKSDIKSHHKSAGEPGYVTGNITFDNLEVYAPNGSPWIYTVTEDTDFLKGYNTWVQAGKVEYDQKETMKADTNKKAGIEDLHAATSANVEPAATFLNEYQRDNQKMGSMEIRKIWMDYENALDLRPDSIEVTVYRTAESQVSDTDNNNYLWEKFAVISLPLNGNSNVDIKYASVPNADKTIRPESCTLTEKKDIYIN